jgi:flagellar basal body-associated protein FliL
MPILLVLLLSSVLAGGGYFYYTDTQNTIAQLRTNNAQLKIVAEDNERTINAMKEDAETNAELAAELTLELQESEQRRNALINIFSRHDLTNLAMKKPGLIEKRLNNGTEKAFDDIESITGNTPTERM